MSLEDSILKVDNIFNFKNSISFITKKNNKYKNQELLQKVLNYKNINSDSIASCIQKHTTNVEYVVKPNKYNNTDGLVTHLDKKIILMIQTADCIPIFLYDPKQQIIGLVHSGWKGTCNSIVKNAINIFIDNKSTPSDIQVYLGPSIKSQQYEIKEDVANFFSKLYITKSANKIFLSIQNKVIDDLLSMNVKKNNIINSDICTFHNLDFCSYRRDGGNAGRMYSLFGVGE